ncbi:hypothetical protein Q7A53_05380 [Halobacillus rhizosphaerae]|uniref:hypothetical protein n=1 Tax=Halobacillus rhizosphaerae TaxID=3064889 RepID=UPI00398A832D
MKTYKLQIATSDNTYKDEYKSDLNKKEFEDFLCETMKKNNFFGIAGLYVATSKIESFKVTYKTRSFGED